MVFVTGFSHSAWHLLALAQKELGASELRADHAPPEGFCLVTRQLQGQHTLGLFFPDPTETHTLLKGTCRLF